MESTESFRTSCFCSFKLPAALFFVVSERAREWVSEGVSVSFPGCPKANPELWSQEVGRKLSGDFAVIFQTWTVHFLLHFFLCENTVLEAYPLWCHKGCCSLTDRVGSAFWDLTRLFLDSFPNEGRSKIQDRILLIRRLQTKVLNAFWIGNSVRKGSQKISKNLNTEPVSGKNQ